MAKNEKLTENQKLQLIRVGKRLRKLRKIKGKSNYEYMAYEMEMAKSQLGGYEKGGNITIATLVRILDFLDSSLEEFFSIDPE
jgi:transcriptional regulator with XRE-family HTH domain